MAERVLSQVLELDVDKCENIFGVSDSGSLCTAGRKDTGTAQAGGASTITLRAGASAVDNFYNAMVVRITGGTGAFQEGVIIGYVGATKVATVSAPWGVAPDGTSTYNVIDRPNACYNGFRTCQDRPNYVKGTQTIRFTGRGAPIAKGTTARPFIKDVSRAVTELDPEEGLAIRSSTSLRLVDDTGSDVELDPYILNRAAPASGTFWARFLARNLNYVGRQARLVQCYVDHGVFGATTTERYLIDSIKGPDSGGDVLVNLKDPSKVLDRTKLPVPTSGKLFIALELNDMQLTLGLGEGAQYASSGYIRHGDEVIRYDGKAGDVLTWSFSIYRGVFGTEPDTGSVGETVQQCMVFVDQSFTDTIHALYNLSGVPDADMDLAGLAAEDATWLGPNYRVTACIVSPEDASTLIKELLQQASMMAWWSPTEQKHKFKVYAPASPANVVTKTLDDDTAIMEQTVEVDRLDNQRFTLLCMNYGLLRATADIREAPNYRGAEVAIDQDAESVNEYGARISKTMYSRWFGSANQLGMRAFVLRWSGRHRDAPLQIKSFHLDPKDGDVAEGQIVNFTTKSMVNNDGTPKALRVLITSRRDRGKHVECGARVTTFDRRYGFIAPDGTPDYPNNNGYACVCQNTGLMTDGSSGYLVI